MIDPSELIGWYPPSSRESSINNLEWVSDEKYDRIAHYLGGRIYSKILALAGLKNIKPLTFKQSIHKKLQEPIYHKELPVYFRKNLARPHGSASCKRYVQLAPINYHADHVQFYVEIFFQGSVGFDDETSQCPLLDPPVRPNEIVLFIGLDCTRKGMLQWNEGVQKLNDSVVYAHGDEVNELTHSLSSLDHAIFSDQIVHFTPDEEQLKCRIQLPRQNLNSPWNAALDSAIDTMLPLVLDTFRKIGNNEVTI
jgi:hypothetical protein